METLEIRVMNRLNDEKLMVNWELSEDLQYCECLGQNHLRDQLNGTH